MSHSTYTVDLGVVSMAVLATNKIEWMPDAQMPQAEGGWSGDDECLSLEGMNNSGPDGVRCQLAIGQDVDNTRPARR